MYVNTAGCQFTSHTSLPVKSRVGFTIPWLYVPESVSEFEISLWNDSGVNLLLTWRSGPPKTLKLWLRINVRAR